MNKNEYTFLTINTESLWETFQDKEAEGTNSIRIAEKGISLQDLFSYTYAQMLRTASVAPVSLAFDACGTLYILDQHEEMILFFDPHSRNFYWFKCLSFPAPESIAVSQSDMYILHQDTLVCLARVNYQIRWKREMTEDVLRIASAGNDDLYLLKKENATGFKICKTDRTLGLQEISLKDENGSLHELIRPVDIASDPHENLYVLEAEGSQIIKCDPAGAILEIIPVAYEKNFTPFALTADIQEDIFLSFEGKQDIIRLQKIQKYKKAGMYITKSLDSNCPDCQWHKVVLEGKIPENTQIMLSYHASNEQQRPDTPLWSGPLVNPKDALLLNAKGRYLRVRIELMSDDLHLNSPEVHSLKVYFPRRSYLRYLPAIYQENQVSKDFLDRFLALFETFLGNLEGTIDESPMLFDVNATPKGFLSWLSGWLGVIRDENWGEKAWREFLSQAVQLYKQRGTKTYLSELIRMYTGDIPIIVEPSLLQCDGQEFKSLLERLFGSTPYNFCVLLKPGQVKTEAERNTVKRIIDVEKPAHTIGGLQVLQPWIVLGGHSYLELNTYLSKPEFILGKAVLPIDTVLEDPEKGAQIERHSRIGIDTLMT